MMTLKLSRISKTDDAVFGQLFSDELSLVTLEPLFDGAPKIPAGVHPLVRHHANHLNCTVWMLADFPDRFFYLHVGNFVRDSDGCIIVGTEVNGDMVTQSDLAFEHLMKVTENETELSLVITDDF